MSENTEAISKIAIIVILYHPGSTVINNIKTYANYADKLILVDNSPNNNSHIAQIFPNSIYIPLYKNYGIAKAINIGCDIAIKQNCQWIITMDQDSSFLNDIIAKYKVRLNQNNIGMLIPYYSYDRTNKKLLQDRAVKLAMQSAAMISVEIYKQIGAYEEKLFIDGVDYDYCYRIREKGYKIVQCHDALLKHSPAKTKQIRILFYTFKYGIASPTRYYYQSRNLLYLLFKYKDLKILAIWLYKLFKICFLFPNKMTYLHFFFKGIKDFATQKFDICYEK